MLQVRRSMKWSMRLRRLIASRGSVRQGDVVLVKASRGMKMEQVVQALTGMRQSQSRHRKEASSTSEASDGQAMLSTDACSTTGCIRFIRNIRFLNVFRYLSFRIIYAAVTAFLIAFVLAPWVIRKLQDIKLGQQIRDDGPKQSPGEERHAHHGRDAHHLCGGPLDAPLGRYREALRLAGARRHAGVRGDWICRRLSQVHQGPIEGIVGVAEVHGASGVALAIALVLYFLPGYTTKLSIPFFKNVVPDLGWFYVAFAVVVIVGSSNAVNLTDGLDGLAIGPVMIAALAYTIVAYVAGHRLMSDYLLIPHIEGAGELAVFTAAILGASLGFLWFNTYPASVFMGDVGSLPLGAALGTVAVISKHELLLLMVGGVFVIEAVSVIFQVISFKSRGKRIFLMAPIHHHFEMKGWEEPKVVVRLWIIAILLALLSLSTLKLAVMAWWGEAVVELAGAQCDGDGACQKRNSGLSVASSEAGARVTVADRKGRTELAVGARRHRPRSGSGVTVGARYESSLDTRIWW